MWDLPDSQLTISPFLRTWPSLLRNRSVILSVKNGYLLSGYFWETSQPSNAPNEMLKTGASDPPKPKITGSRAAAPCVLRTPLRNQIHGLRGSEGQISLSLQNRQPNKPTGS